MEMIIKLIYSYLNHAVTHSWRSNLSTSLPYVDKNLVWEYQMLHMTPTQGGGGQLGPNHVNVIQSRRHDSITQIWCIIFSKFNTQKQISARCALFRTLKNHIFLNNVSFLKLFFSPKNQIIMSEWYLDCFWKTSITYMW